MERDIKPDFELGEGSSISQDFPEKQNQQDVCIYREGGGTYLFSRIGSCNCRGLVSTKGFPGGVVVKNLPDTAGDARDMGSIPRCGRSSREGNGNSFQYSCLENSMDRGAWEAIVHGLQRVGHY